MPKVSVIVPVYKAEKYLDRCVESILAQTYSEWELLLVDDGSPDKSGELCDIWSKKDSRIKVFHKENGGVSSARNLGIELAKGEWITFVDSDDWVDEKYLESFFHNNYSYEKIIYIQGIHYYIPRRDKTLTMFQYVDTSFNIIDNLELFLKYNLLKDGCPVAKLFNRNLIIKNDLYFKENISLNEDHLFVLTYYRFI
ncbi:MAG: glycosyltransferase family 2 protein, partial [Prevotella sp.]|nr:glycosyltransferase family 2 protein [Prevotella sp.]